MPDQLGCVICSAHVAYRIIVSTDMTYRIIVAAHVAYRIIVSTDMACRVIVAAHVACRIVSSTTTGAAHGIIRASAVIAASTTI